MWRNVWKDKISSTVGWPASESGRKPSGGWGERKEDWVQEEAEVTAGALTGGLLED